MDNGGTAVQKTSRCHSCGIDVDTNARRCPTCYVALEAASRAPSPLRAAPTAMSSGAQPARAAVTVVEENRPRVGIRCPSCETTVMPLTGWCPYCMDPLPVDPAKGLEAVSETAPITAVTAVTSVAAGGHADTSGNGAGGRRGPRLAAALIDAVVFVPAVVALAFSFLAAVVLLVVAATFTIWQLRVLQPRTGQTIGKNRLGISRPMRRRAGQYHR
jgi:hypothetical protein